MSGTHGLPAGHRIRPFAPDDLAALTRHLVAVATEDRLPFSWTEGIVHDELLDYHGLDPSRDLLLVEGPEGLHAAGWVAGAVREGALQLDMDLSVAPGSRRRGIGRALLRALEARADERRAEATDGLPTRLTLESHEGRPGGERLATLAGLTPYRWYAVMGRDLAEPLPGPVPVPGLELRPVEPATIRQAIAALDEAFKDHFGHREWVEDDYRRLAEGPDVDPSLWVVAWDGDEVAGASHNSIVAAERERVGIAQGWVDIIGVRPRWRGRGLARWLLTETLHRYRSLGLERTVLGVDLDNPTGALGLYESVGFRPLLRSTMWAKEFPGVPPR
ncbi:MAG: hypothetical protein RL338_1354 [Chloroflexota bacterium]|jgi:mycothiol synthase